MSIKHILHKNDIFVSLALVLLITIIFIPVTNETVLFDSTTYLRIVQTLVETHQLVVMSHFLYPVLVGITKLVLNVNYWLAGAIVVYLSELFLAAILFVMARVIFGRQGSAWASIGSAVFAISLMLVAPVFLLAPIDHHFYFGYIGINVYHNATMALLKPFAILSFLAATQVYITKTKSLALIIGYGISAVLATIAKPSFTVALLPALGVFTLYRLTRKQWVNWRLLLIGIVLPVLFVLGWQYWFTYASTQDIGGGDWHVILAPLAVFKSWSNYLIPKFLLSIVFPLGITIIYFPKVRKEIDLLLAWLIFIFGTAYAYLLAEEGVRITHGNFVWSAQIGLFILFVFTAFFFVKQSPWATRTEKNFRAGVAWKFWVGVALFSLHLLSGIIWYLHHAGLLGEIFAWW